MPDEATHAPDPAHWCSLPVLVEFHQQWWKARIGRIGESQRPYSRDWEVLLADAGLAGVELRREAEKDVRELHANGLLQIKPPPRRPHLIARVHLPASQEMRLAQLLGDPVGAAAPKFDTSSHPWTEELSFLASETIITAAEDILAMDRFLARGGRERPLVPIKERSLDLFGDEKRLDALAATRLFGEGRLTLSALRCFKVPEPLGWRRGPHRTGRVLVLENAATWDSFSRWNELQDSERAYSAVIYGAGYRFLDGVTFLPEIARETGAISRIDYFGDLDPEGLRMPVLAAARCRELGLSEPRAF